MRAATLGKLNGGLLEAHSKSKKLPVQLSQSPPKPKKSRRRNQSNSLLKSGSLNFKNLQK